MGLCSPLWEGRLGNLPPYIISDHWAHVHALLQAARIASHLGYSTVSLVSDRRQACVSALILRPPKGDRASVRGMRSLFNILWLTDLQVHVVHMGKGLNPAGALATTLADNQQALGKAGRLSHALWDHCWENLRSHDVLGTI